MNTIENKRPAFGSMREISQQRKKILTEIRKDNEEMGLLWKDLFRSNAPKKKGITFTSILSTGTGLLDGALLAWKLYRKFKR